MNLEYNDSCDWSDVSVGLDTSDLVTSEHEEQYQFNGGEANQ